MSGPSRESHIEKSKPRSSCLQASSIEEASKWHGLGACLKNNSRPLLQVMFPRPPWPQEEPGNSCFDKFHVVHPKITHNMAMLHASSATTGQPCEQTLKFLKPSSLQSLTNLRAGGGGGGGVGCPNHKIKGLMTIT